MSKPTTSEISAVDRSVSSSSLAAKRIRREVRYSMGDMPTSALNIRYRWLRLTASMEATFSTVILSE